LPFFLTDSRKKIEKKVKKRGEKGRKQNTKDINILRAKGFKPSQKKLKTRRKRWQI